MKSLCTLALVFFVATGSTVDAMRTRDQLGTNYSKGTVTTYECSDVNCQSGCKVVSIANNTQCHPDPLQAGRSSRQECRYRREREGTNCFQYRGFRNSNCDKTGEWHEVGEGCGNCKQTWLNPGHYAYATGCAEGANGTLTFIQDCTDDKCTKNCNRREVPLNKCLTVGEDLSYMASGPFPCDKVIFFQQYEGNDCTGPTVRNDVEFDTMCYILDGKPTKYSCDLE